MTTAHKEIFVRSNENLDYADIERRIKSNLGAMARAADAPPNAWKYNRVLRENGMIIYRTKRRSLINKVGVWFKSFFKLYKTRDQAILGLKLAAESDNRAANIELSLCELKSRLDDFHSLSNRLEGQLNLLEQNSCEAFERAEQGMHRVEAFSKHELARLEAFSKHELARLEAFSKHELARLEAFSKHDAARVEEYIARETSRLDEENKRRVDNTVKQISHLEEVVRRIKDEIMFQQRRVTQLSLSEKYSNGVADVKSNIEIVANERLDSFYAAFEDVFRGERSEIKSRFVKYLDRLKLSGAGILEKPVLDVGCGRGEWLELLKENNIPAYGVDLNGIMVERTRGYGLDARRTDALEHLKSVADSSLSAVTAFHVVEHIKFDDLISFLDEAVRVIVPGGLILLETPNPETMRVGATTFYNDPTHRNPIPPTVLKFMIEHRGFEMAEILRLHPFVDGLLQEPTADAELLNMVLFGPQDYAVIARRL